jgi:folate-binding protein YgfZ
MSVTTLQVAERPRAFVAVRGRDAASYLERMLSNAVDDLAPGETREALLLTAKARVVATMTVLRRSADDFLLLTEPELGETLRTALLRSRFAARCSVELEPHRSTLVLGLGSGGIPNRDYGAPAVELLDAGPPEGGVPVGADELERLRILARTARYGREIDERVLPAEAGLEERAISFTKGCYPGQEPVARLHHRGHANRSLRTLVIEDGSLPAFDTELLLDGKAVGRVTSAAPDAEHGIVALAFVRREIPGDAALTLTDGRPARVLGGGA